MPVPYLPQGPEIEIFRHAWKSRLPLMVKGPTGCGKTRFIQHMAETLERPMVTVACNEDTSATDLLGRHLLVDGDTRWVDGPVTRAVREGALLYLDEIAEARADAIVVIHSLSDHRRELFLDRTGETLKAPDAFMLIVSYNPGYQRSMREMKPSTRQRFVARRFDFPEPELEVEVLQGESGIDAALARKLVMLATALRALKDHDLEEAASTRLLVYAATLIHGGYDPLDACRAALVEPLTDDEETAAALMEVVYASFGT